MMVGHVGILTKGMSVMEFLGVKRWKKHLILHTRAEKRLFTGKRDEKNKLIKRVVPLSKHR